MKNVILTVQCKNCGSPTEFDVIRQSYRCPACRTEMTAESSMEKVLRRREEIQEELKSELRGQTITLYECPNCGAKVSEEKEKAVHRCGFCGSEIVGRELLETEHFPEYIIPFYFTLDEAKGIAKKWAKAHGRLKGAKQLLSRLNDLRGYYLPYQLVEGPLGMRIQRSNTERMYYAEGFVSCKPVNVSRQLDNLLLDAMEPFDWSALQPVRMEFLVKEKVKFQDLTGRELEDRIKEEAKEDSYPHLCKALGTNGIVVYPDVSRTAVVSALLPVYVLKGSNFEFVINGQTGRVAFSTGKTSRKFSWVIPPILWTGGCAAALALYFRDVKLVFYGTVLAGILFFVLYSEDRISVIKRIWGKGDEVRAKRKGKELEIHSEKTKTESSRVKPVFFERIDGTFLPVEFKVLSFSRILRLLFCAVFIIGLPIFTAIFIANLKEQPLPAPDRFVGATAWFALMIPVMIIVGAKSQKELYEHPIFWRIDGNKKKKIKGGSRYRLLQGESLKSLFQKPVLWLTLFILFLFVVSTAAILY